MKEQEVEKKGKGRMLEEQGRNVEMAQRDPQPGPELVLAIPQLLL